MTTGNKFRAIRKELGISQEAIGAQGFISAPGWIKLENGQRQPSEKLIKKLYEYVKTQHGWSESKAHKMKLELLLLKYSSDVSKFPSVMAAVYAEKLNIPVLAQEDDGKPGRGRPKHTSGLRRAAAAAKATRKPKKRAVAA